MPIELRRHPRAGKFVLRVSGGVIQLTIPTRARLADGLAWARQQTAFVEKKLAEEPAPVLFAMGAELPLLGETVRIVAGLKVPGELAPGALAIAPAGAKLLAVRIERLLRARALAEGQRELERYWKQLGVAPTPVTVRSYRRRWGACGVDGSTALNWRLVFAPQEVLSYVAAHEAAHRLEMNHGPNFWAILRELFPSHREQEAWLAAHGSGLYAYG